MAFLQLSFGSDLIGHSCQVNIILPQRGPADHGSDLQVLWLLHGSGDDHTIWQRFTSIERYSGNLAVVMPAAAQSYYANMAHGPRYFDFLADELPRTLRDSFRFSARRADNFVAGLSMGGYGAFKLALSYPERYAAAASLSGALDLAALIERRLRGPEADPHWQRQYSSIFDDPDAVRGSSDDLFHLLEQADPTTLPKLYASCGTQDFLYADNQTFLEYARSLGVNLNYYEEPGDHEWGFWDRNIQKVLAWLPAG